MTIACHIKINSFDLIQISSSACVRKIVLSYSLIILGFSFLVIFLNILQKPAFVLNLIGLWIPTGFSLIISIIFFKRIDSGLFRKEKWPMTY